MGELYDTDIMEWSKQQARLLRGMASGEAIPTKPDWLRLADEVEGVGRAELFAVRSLLRRALTHMLRAEAWPLSHKVDEWQAEARRFRMDAADRFAPSMRQHLSIDRLYRQARHAMPQSYDGTAPLLLPTTCPVTLDELLSDEG